jgi:hypothetical protein
MLCYLASDGPYSAVTACLDLFLLAIRYGTVLVPFLRNVEYSTQLVLQY